MRDDRRVSAHSLDLGLVLEKEVTDLRPDGTLDLVQATLRVMGVKDGADLFLHADAPPGSGLGTSSTVAVALVGLVNEWQRLSMTPYDVAALAHRIERCELGMPGGEQDQYAACFGGFNYIEFYGDHVVVTPLRVHPSTLHELSYSLKLFYTGRTRDSGDIIVRQTEQLVAKNPTTVDSLRALKALTQELRRALLLGNVPEFGRILHTAWQAKRQLAVGITTDYIDQLYAMALEEGAWGGKILGAGGGGYLLVAAPYKASHRIAAALTSAGAKQVPFAFEWEGLTTWRAMES